MQPTDRITDLPHSFMSCRGLLEKLCNIPEEAQKVPHFFLSSFILPFLLFTYLLALMGCCEAASSCIKHAYPHHFLVHAVVWIQSNKESDLRLSFWKKRRITLSGRVKNDHLTEGEAAGKISGSCGRQSRIYRKYQLHLETTNRLLEATKGQSAHRSSLWN